MVECSCVYWLHVDKVVAGEVPEIVIIVWVPLTLLFTSAVNLLNGVKLSDRIVNH